MKANGSSKNPKEDSILPSFPFLSFLYASSKILLKRLKMKTFRPAFVRNAEAAAAVRTQASIQTMVINLLPKLVRMDKMENRDYIVVPMVILTEGVHHGSEGPMLYPKEELAKTPAVWNHKPVVVYHPEMNGQGISACDPTIITNRKVGVMMNTKFEGGRLKSEAWIEKDRANLVDERIMTAIEGNVMMELSTGVFIDMEEEPGDWNGESYIGVARNYRPDHLALLPDKIGACSIADGAGFLRNQAASGTDSKKHGSLVSLFHKMMKFANNELSFDNTRESLSTALRAKFKANNDNGPYLWVADVYSNFVIYEFNSKLFRIGYTADDTGVKLSDEDPAEVKRVTEYRSVTGAFVGNGQAETQNEKHNMDKKKLVDNLIANSNGNLVEADRDRLMAFSEEQLSKIAFVKPEPAAAAPAPANNNAPAPAAPAPAPAPASTAPAAPVQNKVVSLQEYVDGAPKEIQEVLRNSLEVHNEEKVRLVDAILANKENSFTKDELNVRPLGELRKLARLSGAAVQQRGQHFGGQGFVPDVVDNAAGEETPLEMPAIEFGKVAAK